MLRVVCYGFPYFAEKETEVPVYDVSADTFSYIFTVVSDHILQVHILLKCYLHVLQVLGDFEGNEDPQDYNGKYMTQRKK